MAHQDHPSAPSQWSSMLPEHINYLLDFLPTVKKPLSDPLANLISILQSHPSIASPAPLVSHQRALKPSGSYSVNSRGDKKLASIRDRERKKKTNHAVDVGYVGKKSGDKSRKRKAIGKYATSISQFLS